MNSSGLDLAAFVERQPGGGFYGIDGRDRRDQVASFLRTASRAAAKIGAFCSDVPSF